MVVAYISLGLSLIALVISIICFRRKIKGFSYQANTVMIKKIETIQKEVDQIKKVVEVKN